MSRILALVAITTVGVVEGFAQNSNGADSVYEFDVEQDDGTIEKYYGRITQGGWDAPTVMVELDQPWRAYPEVRTFKTDRMPIAPREERPDHRASRLEREGWEAGYVQVETASGTQWRPIAEVQYAERAREMARQAWGMKSAKEESGPTSADPAPVETRESAEGMAEPVSWTAWWRHAAVALAAVVLIGIIGRFMVLG